MCLRKHIVEWVFAAAIATGAGFLVAAPSAAQGFMVKPMKLEAPARAGQSIELPIEIRNTAGDAARPIQLRIVELSQTSTGAWSIGDPEKGSPAASAIGWTTLGTDRLEIDPLQPAEVLVRFSPPANARGAYVVGVIAEEPRREDATGLTIRMRFLIPVIVEIQGRPVRQRIKLDDLVMSYHDGSSEPATTKAHLRVVNDGQTYSRVSGLLQVERKDGDRWRHVTRFEIAERSIIPGVALELGEDLARRLPTGDYRLRGQLNVDGRRVAGLDKEIAFVGDPRATLAYDAGLLLQPEMVDMEIVPGAARTAVLRVENPGQDPVKVKAVIGTPRGLIGFQAGDVVGSDLSAEPWTVIQPAEFTLRPGGRQNVRVVSRVPRGDLGHPNYYAELVLSGTYADGQSAGEMRSTVHLAYRGAEPKPAATVQQISLSEAEKPGSYIVDVAFANIGDVHLTPTARVFLLSAQGTGVRNVALSGDDSSLLPLHTRTFSGDLDIADVKPGYYTLQANVMSDKGLEFTGRQVLLIESADPASGGTAPRVTLVDSASVPSDLKTEAGDGNVVPLDKPTNEGTKTDG